MAFFFVCQEERERAKERESEDKNWSEMRAVVLFPQDRGLGRPHISDCCQAWVRGRDSEGQLFSAAHPGSPRHGL